MSAETVSTKVSDWHDMLVTLSNDTEFPLASVERGLVFALLAAPPVTLSQLQVATLASLKRRYVEYLKTRHAGPEVVELRS